MTEDLITEQRFFNRSCTKGPLQIISNSADTHPKIISICRQFGATNWDNSQ